MADLGKIGITYDSNGYVATTPYEPLTVLKYTDGGTYMSILPTTGHVPTDTNYWACMVPPTEASIIDYTPLASGVITNTTVQGAIEQADSLKFNKASVVQTNVNNSETVPNSALLYSLNAALNSKLVKDTVTGIVTVAQSSWGWRDTTSLQIIGDYKSATLSSLSAFRGDDLMSYVDNSDYAYNGLRIDIMPDGRVSVRYADTAIAALLPVGTAILISVTVVR